jgi:hypothetical protein
MPISELVIPKSCRCFAPVRVVQPNGIGIIKRLENSLIKSAVMVIAERDIFSDDPVARYYGCKLWITATSIMPVLLLFPPPNCPMLPIGNSKKAASRELGDLSTSCEVIPSPGTRLAGCALIGKPLTTGFTNPRGNSGINYWSWYLTLVSLTQAYELFQAHAWGLVPFPVR